MESQNFHLLDWRQFFASLPLGSGQAHWLVGADPFLWTQLAQDLASFDPHNIDRRWHPGLAWRQKSAAGVNVVFGLETLFPELTVLDNLFVGRPASWRRPGDLAARAKTVFNLLGSNLVPAMPALQLSRLQRHSLALARAMLTPAPLTVIHCDATDRAAAGQLNRAARFLLQDHGMPMTLVVLARNVADVPWITQLHCVRAGRRVYDGPADADWRQHWAVATAESLPECESAIQRALKHMQDTGRSGGRAFAQAAMGLGRVCLRTAVLHCVFVDRMGQTAATAGPRQQQWIEPARQRLSQLRVPGAPRDPQLLETLAGTFQSIPLIGKDGVLGLLLTLPSKDETSRESGSFVQLFGRMLGEVIGEEMLQVQLAHVRRLDTLGSMAGGLVHDFNNTLYVINSAATLAGIQAPNDATRRQLEVIRKAVQQAGALTAKLRSFGQRQDPKPVPLDLHDAVLDALTLLRVAAGSMVQIDCALDAKQSRMVGDPASLINMVVNLGMNAVNAMGGDGPKHIQIRTSSSAGGPSSWLSLQGARHHGAYLDLEMTDTGCGMDAATMARLFEPFFTTRADSGGTGLGLATVIQTVRQHSGAIDIRSDPGVGTTVRLRFPVAEVWVREPAVLPSQQLPAAAIAGLHVLLCDDDDLSREVLAQQLQSYGLRITTAANGRDCVSLYAQSAESYDVVMLDYRMPDMNGDSCFRALHTLNPDVRAFILSGHASEVDGAGLQALGLRGVFNKPMEVEALLDVIAAAADG